MDFLKIRKKAKERAAAAGATPAPAGSAAPDAPPPSPDPSADADALEGQLAARLQGLAPPDPRFTTWRPGSGAPPAVIPPPPPAPPPDPRAEDFTVVSGLAAAARAAPVPEPPARAPAPEDPLDDFFYRDDEQAPDVPLLGAPAAEPGEASADAFAREEYLTFLLGSEEYAVAIERVREVMKAPPITEVPRAPPHVLGVITVRGEVVPIFDPRRRLGLHPGAPAQGASRIVVVDAGSGPCGLLVDRVASVVRLRPGSIEPCPHGIAAGSADCLGGIGRHGDGLFMVLDLGALLRRGGEGVADAST